MLRFLILVLASKKNQIGQVTGLAWTQVGGELLTIETVVVPGKGKTIITGKLGDVMQESIHAAMSVVRSRADVLGIDSDFYETKDIHIHFPRRGYPKRRTKCWYWYYNSDNIKS